MENTIDATRAAELLGVTVKTLQRLEREGKLLPVGRTARAITAEKLTETLEQDHAAGSSHPA